MTRLPRLLGALCVICSAGVGMAVALDAPPGDPETVELLSGINHVPDRSAIDSVLGETAVSDLVQIAEDASVDSDPGLRIRAYRALREYDENPQKTTAAAAFRRAIVNFEAVNVGTELLYLRSSMVGLATIDGGNSVPDLVSLLGHPSRDIRAACAQALGITGSGMAIQPLRDRALVESEPQVKLAIADALFQIDSGDS